MRLLTILAQVPRRSPMKRLVHQQTDSSCIDAPHHYIVHPFFMWSPSFVSSLQSSKYRTTYLTFLSFSILHICPKSSSFLVIIFCIRFSMRSILLYNSAFVTFCIQSILRIFL